MNLNFTTRFLGGLGALGALVLMAAPALAQEAEEAAPVLDSGDTAWMLVASAVVLMMCIPGLALFYGGMVRKKNVLSVLMQCFAAAGLITVLWVVAGYSLTFTEGTPYIGGLDKVMLAGLTPESLTGTIPESLFMMFQMTFAIITPALICGAFVDRMKFSAYLWFIGTWLFAVYVPVAHWVWGGGFLGSAGVLDFAGGTVVHINAGVAGLMAAIVLGRRRQGGLESFAPHNLVYSVIGASLLWVGWFGFNAGSALSAGAGAAMAMAVTQIATAAAALAWMAVEWIVRGKANVLGIISGAIAGLVAITPACGFVGVGGALAIGVAAGAVCYWGSTWLKARFGYDDSLDVFGIHGIGGIVGAVLTGVFAMEAVGGTPGLLEGNPAQVWLQLYGVAVTVAYAGVVSWVLLKIIDLAVGLRVSPEIEQDGLDLGLHGERVE